MIDNNINLLQDKLDVLTKKRSNTFNWRGQFTPEFVEYMLQNFAKQGDFVLDPFSGSGTVLQEAARNHMKATGVEINPAAYAMSKFFTFCNFDYSEKLNCYSEFEKKINSQLINLNGQTVYDNNSDYRLAYANLLEFAKNINPILCSKQERILLLNILFQSEKDKSLKLKDSIYKSLLYVKNILFKLHYSEEPINALLNDSRNVGDEFSEEVDLILTSPPYINVFNYHQNFRAIVETFHFDILKVAHSEFGSNRKNRSNRFKTVVQYCLDMELAIRSFWKSLKPNSTLILILGRESNVRNTPFYNGQMVIEILESSKGFSNIQTLERKFMNKFGNDIKEDIIIATKTNNLSATFCGRKVALKHLENTLAITQNGVCSDIRDAINEINEVMPSPIFNPKNVIKNEQYTA
jgi:DNA modification methylase